MGNNVYDPIADDWIFMELFHTSVQTIIYVVDKEGYVKQIVNPNIAQFCGTFLEGFHESYCNRLEGWFAENVKGRANYAGEQRHMINDVERMIRAAKFDDHRDDMRSQFGLSLEALSMGIDTCIAVSEADQHYIANINWDNLSMIKAYFEGPVRALTEYGPLFTCV